MIVSASVDGPIVLGGLTPKHPFFSILVWNVIRFMYLHMQSFDMEWEQSCRRKVCISVPAALRLIYVTTFLQQKSHYIFLSCAYTQMCWLWCKNAHHWTEPVIMKCYSHTVIYHLFYLLNCKINMTVMSCHAFVYSMAHP